LLTAGAPARNPAAAAYAFLCKHTRLAIQSVTLKQIDDPQLEPTWEMAWKVLCECLAQHPLHQQSARMF